MSTTQAPAASLDPDRSTTLIVAGTFEILLGCLCVLIAVMMVSLNLLGPIARAPREEEPSPLLGKAAPPVDLERLDGKRVQLTDHTGKDVVMLDFWATWCGPCGAELPLLVDVAKDYESKGVAFYAIDLRESKQVIDEFLKTQKLDLAVALDKDHKVADAYGVSGIPLLVLVDKQGIVQSVHVGYDRGIKSALHKELDGLLAGKNLAAETIAKYQAKKQKKEVASTAVSSADLPASPEGPQDQAMNRRVMTQVMVVYLLMAVALISLGIGLVSARRWAWTLTVVLSWMWLIKGAIAFVMAVFFIGKVVEGIAQQGELRQGVLMAMRIAGAVVALIYTFPPAVLLLLCHHDSVRAICQREDPKFRWTDRCPMPVLALSIFLTWLIVSLLSQVAFRCVMPLFGVFISGAAGAVLILLMTLVMAYLAWGTYRLQRTAWWGTLLVGIAGTVNMVVTFSRTGLTEMYEKMGMPADQIELIRKMGMVEMISRGAPWMGLAGGAGLLAYLLFVRRYFVHRGAAPIATA
jgi:thiol-disulfide isomerase/thioredoxin